VLAFCEGSLSEEEEDSIEGWQIDNHRAFAVLANSICGMPLNCRKQLSAAW